MPSPKATFREIGEVTIIDLTGTLMLGPSGAVIRPTITELIGTQRRKVILNFRDVAAIDSAGVGELLAVHAAMKARNGRLKLLNPPQKILDMLALTQLSRVLEVCTNEHSALRSFD